MRIRQTWKKVPLCPKKSRTTRHGRIINQAQPRHEKAKADVAMTCPKRNKKGTINRRKQTQQKEIKSSPSNFSKKNKGKVKLKF